MTISGNNSSIHAKSWVPYVILSFLVILAYGPALFNTFVIDDHYVLLDNAAVKSLKNIPSLFSRNYFNLFAEQSYRPVVSFSYMLDYRLWGLQLPWYHLHNLILHILNVLLVYVILSRIPNGSLLAFMTAGLFAVHTISGEPVNVISTREDLQVAFFLLLSLWCFVKILLGGKTFYRYILWTSCFLAVPAKENGVTLPLLLAGAGLIIHGRRFYRDHKITCIGAMAAFLLSMIVRFIIMTSKVEAVGPLSLQGSLLEKGIKIVKIQGIYLQSLAYLRPFLPNMGGEIISGSLDGDFIYGMLSIVLLLCWALFLRKRSAWIALLFYAAAMIPVSNVFMTLYNPVAYRYIYFPALGLYFLAGISFNILVEKYKISGRVLWPALFLILAPQAVYSSFWSRYWRDEEALWKYQVSHTPEYYRPWADLAAAQNNKGLYVEAEVSAKKALSLKPDYFYAWSALGYSQLYQGSYNQALESFQKASEFPCVKSGRAEIFFGMGYAFEQTGRISDAEKYYEKVLELNPRHLGGMTNLAILLIQTGDRDKAQNLLEKVIEINPGDAEAHYNLALLFLQRGEKEKARSLLFRALKIDPENSRIKNLSSRL
jgi:tetratricopeptide (TPR) repeat protein